MTRDGQESQVENIFLLTVDSLRADHMSVYGYDRPTTPALETFAEEGVQFTNAYATSSHTRESVPSLLSGQYPHQAIDENYRISTITIAERLSHLTNGAFHSNPYLSQAFGFGTGFDTFDDDLRFGGWKIATYLKRAWDRLRNRFYARAETINSRALDWLADHDSSVFLWNHYMDPHDPYEPPVEYAEYFDVDLLENPRQLHKRADKNPEKITDNETRQLIDLYDAEIRYTDAQLGSFLDRLTSNGWLEDSLIIITADHGEAFGEAGYYGHPRQLSEALAHVPMIVAGPGFESDQTIHTPVSTLDIVPTVLRAQRRHTDDLPGVPLQAISTRDTDDRVVFSEASDDQHPNVRRYAAWSAADSCICKWDEKDDTIDITYGGNQTLRKKLEDHIKATDTRDGLVQRADTEGSEEIERRLRELGYKE